MFHKHEWDVITEKTLPSAWELMGEEKQKTVTNMKGDVFIQTHILIMKCAICGEIYKSVEKSG